MSIYAKIPVTGKPRCARCGRPFTPKSPGQDVGPKCARTLAAQFYNLDDIAETRHTVIV